MEHERYAGEGEVWICMACGKVSPYDRYGDSKSDRGWDISCCVSSQLISLETLEQYRERFIVSNEENTNNI